METDRKNLLIQKLTTEQIDQHIFKHYNYNGVEAHEDLKRVVAADAARKVMRKYMPVWVGMTAVSGYNVSRMGVLSASGRIGAIGGLFLGAGATLYSLNC